MQGGVRLSIGLPVYNGARYLREALEALLAQTFGDFELIISDNASTDETPAICAEYAARDPRIRSSANPRNLGVAANFERVFELGSGELFKWAVYDDVCEPTYLARCVETLDAAGPEVVLAYPRTVLIDSLGGELERYADRMHLVEQRPHERLAHLLRELRFCHCALGVIRRDVLAQTRRIEGFESSDVVLLHELAMRGRFHEHPEFLYRRRIHPDSSFQAYESPESHAARMDPAIGDRLVLPRLRQFVESSRSIARAPIGALEQLRCWAVLLAIWGPRYWRVVGGELKRALVQRLD